MIVDTSALIAILRDEPAADQCLRVLADASTVRISAPNFLEAAIVVDRSSDAIGRRRFEEFIRYSNMVIEPFTQEQAAIAREAYRDFGKGSGHRAGLNFGDCFAYALAKISAESLLYVGDDFVHTDILAAVTE